ncbi:MAG: (Fe-S)-binding protein [Elusimicrobiota bacterium]|nr:(Fe-S)-binding protein [Elusimicrobiota bacterium]
MAEALDRLLTDLGERSTYDAVSQCSRCGYCEQSCPTYLATGEESKSPRGRNQLLRQLIEGKLADRASAEEAFSTCLLCGACQTACYARVPVPDLALEGRRLLRGAPHPLVKLVTRWQVERPGLLRLLLKAGFLMKRLGLSRLGRPFLRRVGLPVLAAMDEHVDDAPLEFADEALARKPQSASPAWLYYPPCGPRYLHTEVADATWTSLTALLGPGALLKAGCCGLLAHNYGDLEDARVQARALIEAAEGAGSAPIVGDCSSCVAHLKSYPQLFLKPEDASWRARAAAFSARVRDALEVYREKAPALGLAPESGVVTWHDSCRGLNGSGLKEGGRPALKALCPEGFRELGGAGECCGGAGAYAFVHDALSDEVLRRKVAAIASTQAAVVVASSTSCLIQLARGLKTYYPEAKALHLSQFVARSVDKHGS